MPIPIVMLVTVIVKVSKIYPRKDMVPRIHIIEMPIGNIVINPRTGFRYTIIRSKAASNSDIPVERIWLWDND